MDQEGNTAERAGVPAHVWAIVALLSGLILGGLFPDNFAFVARGTKTALNGFIAVVPLVIVFALSPAVTKIVQIGKGAKMAGSLVAWFLLSSVVAGLIGLIMSSIVFDIQFTTESGQLVDEVLRMLALLDAESGASWPLLAIVVAVVLGLMAKHLSGLSTLLASFDRAMHRSTPYLARAMPYVVFFLGVTLGVNTGAAESLKYYTLMTVYTLALCAVWWAIYVFVVLRVFAPQPTRKLLAQYYFPTALFAAGTCSSLATLPVNLGNIKIYGVSAPVANFVIPIGAVINMDMSAMAYVAYAPFIMTVMYDLPVTWMVLLVAWPAIAAFTIAAPGLPAGMGTALWSSTLFASLLGLGDDAKTEFVTTWVALSGGLPDMLRTATNCTNDGFTAALFDKYYGEAAHSKVPSGNTASKA